MSALETSLNRRRLMQLGAATTAAAAGLTTVSTHTFAQEATPAEGGLPPLPDGAVLVAEGLWNPGNLVFGPDGTLYIAESGVAATAEGPPPTGTPDPLATPADGPPPLVRPQISMVSPDGEQSVLTDEAGGIGIGFYEGEVFVSTGGTSVSMGMIPQPEENTISAVNVETGETRLVASLGEYEVENNPDDTDVNPNLYGLDITDDGLVYVTDAGGNAIYTVAAESGEFELFAVVPDLTVLTGAEPDPEFGARQAVPIAAVLDDGGNINVALLAEGWDGPGILAYAPDGTYTEGVAGLSTIVNAALGPDGLMYVSQLTADFSGEMPAPGNVFRINADGTIEAVVENLFFPHGIAFDADGNLFVTVNSIISAPDAPAGQVIRIDGVAV